MATITLSRLPDQAQPVEPQRPARRLAARRVERELLIAQANHARAAMGPDYGTNITGMSSENFKARMRRMMGRG